MVLSFSFGLCRDHSDAEHPTNTGQDISRYIRIHPVGLEGQHLRNIGCIYLMADPSVKTQKYRTQKTLSHLVQKSTAWSLTPHNVGECKKGFRTHILSRSILCPFFFFFFVESECDRLLAPGCKLWGWQTALLPALLCVPHGLFCLASTGPHMSGCGVMLLQRHVLWEKESWYPSPLAALIQERLSPLRQYHIHWLSMCIYVVFLWERVLAMREGEDSRMHIWTSPKTKLILCCSQQLRSICESLSLDFTSFSHSDDSWG